jgi:hypothetical protein
MVKNLRLGCIVLVMSVCGAMTACSNGSDSVEMKEASLDLSAIAEDMRTVARARVLLGHQSVGRDVLAGLATLSAETGVPLRVVQIDGLPPDEEPGVFHSSIGENGDPNSKCEMFSQLLTREERPAYDLAMMKFCYVDIDEGVPLTQEQMFDSYEKLVENIKAKRPDVTLVHITVPLRADPPGKRTWLYRKLGMAVYGDEYNVARNRFNDALRERFGAEPMFDLAAVESTLPDGSRSSFERDGKTIYTLAPGYTHDGGHLNPPAQRRAAAALIKTLAETLRNK